MWVTEKWGTIHSGWQMVGYREYCGYPVYLLDSVDSFRKSFLS